jgi:hypothetical protein
MQAAVQAPAHPVQHAAAPQHPARGELIKAAAAGTPDDGMPVASAHPHVTGQQDQHPRRGGTAMLLAALALMSGIALRRYGADRA